MLSPPPGYGTRQSSETSFIIFVDAIFTTLFQRLFTNASVVIRANAAIPCVYRACNAD
jgi:hypothetical protein